LYKYFDYENELATRELTSFGAIKINRTKNEFTAIFNDDLSINSLRGLTYFKSYKVPSLCINSLNTLQHELELTYHNDVGRKRQQTRYSVHCWHEYKGRFNPQIVHGILNCFFKDTNSVLDPFCGSGTTLVECAHKGISAVGIDVNPFSVFLSRAKINALHARTSQLKLSSEIVFSAKPRQRSEGRTIDELNYLNSWFPDEIVCEIEGFRHAITTRLPEKHQGVFLCLMSDLLRNYSHQEPSDLRIRRRFSSFPAQSFKEALIAKVSKSLESLERTRGVTGTIQSQQSVRHGTAEQSHMLDGAKFDGIVTSPPYATALPYVDTQRLSLIWLGLVAPKELAATEELLIGAREAEKKTLLALQDQIWNDCNGLPLVVNKMIRDIASKHGGSDGFRKKAVPALLFRYFTRMKASLEAMRSSVRIGGTAVLVVGTNKTTSGGVLFEIPTPNFIGHIGETVGWNVRELFPLQTYHRYGLHAENAVHGEALVVLN